MKKLISLLLVVAMILVWVSVPVFAETETMLNVQPTQVVAMSVSEEPIVMPTIAPTMLTETYVPVETCEPGESCEPGEAGKPPTPTPTLKPTDKPTVKPKPTPTPAASVVPSATATMVPATKGNKLAKAKRNAKRNLEKYLNLDNYDREGKELIKTLILAAKQDINKLKSVKQIEAYVKVAKKILKDVPTKAEVRSLGKARLRLSKKTIVTKKGKISKLKVKILTDIVLPKSARQVSWTINKKGKKAIKFVKGPGELKNKLKVKVKALKKGEAKITCKMTTGKKVVCKVTVV